MSTSLSASTPVGSNVRPAKVVLLVALVVALFLAPFYLNQGILFIVGLTLIQAIFALSWNLLFGFTGLASFGHAGFYGIGAYFTGAALRYDFQLPFIVVLLLAGVCGALVAWAIGVVALKRLTGIFLAVLTVALTEALGKLIGFSKALGEQDGLGNIPRPIINFGLFDIDLTHSNDYYRFLVVATVIIIAALWWVVHSRVGRTFRAIREDAERAAFVGINVAGPGTHSGPAVGGRTGARGSGVWWARAVTGRRR